MKEIPLTKSKITIVDPIEAAKAYDAAALKNFGQYAFLNFPTKG